MNDAPSRRNGFGLLGLGAAACAACCAGPVLAVLGGLSIAGAASTFVFGTAGALLGTVAVAIGLPLRGRRRVVDAETLLLSPIRRHDSIAIEGKQ